MSKGPLVSIVLATCNGARYLRLAVESILAQTYEDWELILVDDASTDRTPELIAELQAIDSRIRSVRHPQNRRLPAALNTGFAAARGAYHAWTSDDNLYRPHAIATLVGFLEEHPQFAMVYADYSTTDEEGNVTGRVVVAPPHTLAYFNGIGPCVLYRQSVHQRLGGYSGGSFTAEDYEFWVRTACAFRIAPLHEDLYLYRLHSGSLTTLHPDRVEAATALVLSRHLGQMQWAGREARAQGHLLLAGYARRQRNFPDMCRRWWRAAWLSPRLVAGRIAGKIWRAIRGATKQ